MRRRKLRIALAASLLLPVGVGSAAAAPLSKGPLVQVSGASPIANCDGDDGNIGGTNVTNSEVEPWLSVDPSNPNILIGAWQQDRWSNGGSGLVTAKARKRRSGWTVNATTRSTKCTGGTAANGGNYERASDPWLAISPNGTAYLMSLSVDSNPGGFDTSPNAMLVMRSTNHGATWENPVTLIRDESQNVLNDKNSITADPNNAKFVYAVGPLLSPPSGNTNQRAFSARAFGGTSPGPPTAGSRGNRPGRSSRPGPSPRPSATRSSSSPTTRIQWSADRRVHPDPRHQGTARGFNARPSF